MTMDSSDGQSARIFVGNVAPDTDPDLIEQQFKVKDWEENVLIFKPEQVDSTLPWPNVLKNAEIKRFAVVPWQFCSF